MPSEAAMEPKKLQYSRRLCNCLFMAKATIAFALGVGFLSLIAFWISQQYMDEQKLIMAETKGHGRKCQTLSYAQLGRLEGPIGNAYVGFSLAIDGFSVQNLPVQPSIVNFAVTMTDSDFQQDSILSAAQSIAADKSKRPAMLLSIRPQAVKPAEALLFKLAQLVRVINNDLQLPVFLRFGYDMNTPWMPYGFNAVGYKQSFVTLASYVRNQTNMTAMVWSPRIGTEYPFTGYFADPGSGIPASPNDLRFDGLDTNGDGRVNALDDPYSPYYPGDEWVDWVGLSVFQTTLATGTQQTIESSPNALTDRSLLTSISAQGIDEFYLKYTANKPFMLAETGSPYLAQQQSDAGITDAAAIRIKQTWVQAAFNLLATAGQTADNSQTFSRVKAIVFRNDVVSATDAQQAGLVDTQDIHASGATRDFRLTSGDMGQSLTQIVNANQNRLIHMDKVTFQCNGALRISQ